VSCIHTGGVHTSQAYMRHRARSQGPLDRWTNQGRAGGGRARRAFQPFDVKHRNTPEGEGGREPTLSERS
jgi:hypothetical protein